MEKVVIDSFGRGCLRTYNDDLSYKEEPWGIKSSCLRERLKGDQIVLTPSRDDCQNCRHFFDCPDSVVQAMRERD